MDPTDSTPAPLPGDNSPPTVEKPVRKPRQRKPKIVDPAPALPPGFDASPGAMSPDPEPELPPFLRDRGGWGAQRRAEASAPPPRMRVLGSDTLSSPTIFPFPEARVWPTETARRRGPYRRRAPRGVRWTWWLPGLLALAAVAVLGTSLLTPSTPRRGLATLPPQPTSDSIPPTVSHAQQASPPTEIAVAPPALVQPTAPAAPPAPPGGPAGYVVQRGDTLAGIAHRFGVGVGALARFNGLADPNRIYAGQRLLMPPTGGGGEDAPPLGQEWANTGAIVTVTPVFVPPGRAAFVAATPACPEPGCKNEGPSDKNPARP